MHCLVVAIYCIVVGVIHCILLLVLIIFAIVVCSLLLILLIVSLLSDQNEL